MSKYVLIFMILGIFGFACKNKNDNCIKARVVRVTCASFVVQVLNKDSVGNYGWRDIRGNTVYNNVFRVANSCKIGKWSKGEEIYFTLKDSALSSDCIACMMHDSPPGKSYEVVNVSRRCK